MAKENPWFKFEPAEWMFGRIQRQTHEVKAVFLDLICKYWHRQCEMTLEDAELDFGVDNIKCLLDNKIIITEEGAGNCMYITIHFLDSQMEDIEQTAKKNSDSGKRSAEVRRLKKLVEQPLNYPSTTVEPNPTDKKRGDEIKQEKMKEDRAHKFASSVQGFKENYDLKMIEGFISYWTESGEKQKKLRFEFEKVFDIKKRLVTWSNRQNNGPTTKRTGDPNNFNQSEQDYSKPM